MATILAGRRAVTVGQLVNDIPEDELTTRERMRIRALMGQMPIHELAEFPHDELRRLLASSPSGRLADQGVIPFLTVAIQRKRIRVITKLLLERLNGDPAAYEVAKEAVAAPTFVEPAPQPPERPGPKPGPPAAQSVPNGTPIRRRKSHKPAPRPRPRPRPRRPDEE